MLKINLALKSALLIASMREAIYYEDDVPSQWKEYSEVNTKFFVEIGSPGGAAKLGPIGKDHQTVAALPPQEK
jgi:ferredoxin